MKVKFDSLNRFEMPKFYVCNPGSKYKSGLLTNVLGCLSDTADEEMILNFNAVSELNMRVYKVFRSDPDERTYTTMLYNALQNRRMLFVEDVGYFIITSVDADYDHGKHYKDVKAESVEIELQNKLVPYIEDGTYKFTDLLEKVIEAVPMWTIGDVDSTVANKHRTFTDVSVELNSLAFLQENMQDAYECIVEFDCVNRRINVYDQNNYIKETQIHLTKDDLIATLNISNGSEDLYTALNVQGDDNLNISPVNPMGTNVIYNFSYYLEWMSESLRERVREWQNLVSSKADEYYNLNLSYYEKLTSQSDLNSEIDRLNTQLDMYQRCRDNIVAEGSTSTVESYNKVIEENGGVPVGIQNELAATLSEIDSLMTSTRASLTSCKNDIALLGDEITVLKESIVAIHDSVAITTHFSQEEYDELSNYIFEGSYTDQYIAVTSIMSYSEKFEQMKTLYDRAMTRLERVSEPSHEFSMDVENFIFAQEFEQWTRELEAGSLINVELEVGDVALLFLSNMTVNYEDKSLKMTFGNRFSRFDPKAVFNGVLGDIKKSANSINYIKEILYPVKEGEFDAMREAIESSGILTKNSALASTNQEILIDDTGILGRRILDNGEYDDKQIKITNQTIVFTDDGWETARTAIGSFLFNSPLSGEVEEHYGVIADTLVGSLVLSEEVGIYNTENSITLDKNGFTLTNDQTGGSDSKNIFTIQRKLLDDNGNEYYDKQLYIDENGNLVLNGTISIFTSAGTSTSLDETISKAESMDKEIEYINKELQKQSDAIAGIDGIFFFVRYSDNESGNPMYENPKDSTMYMGTCSTHINEAPTSPSEYAWVRLRFDGENGTPGVDGTSQFFHVKYSDDGLTFTAGNGEEIGDWMGTCVTTEESDPTNFDAYEWHKIKGDPGTDGLDGKDGIPGKDGSDGKTTYFHVKYANTDSPTSESEMTEMPSKYIGTYVDYAEADSKNPADYQWVKFMGDDGVDGIPGVNGTDGKTYYLHIKYSDDGGETFTDSDGESTGKYIGVYTDETQADSMNTGDYKWSLLRGKDGTDGKTYYTWIKYADSPTSGMSDIPDGKLYMGFAYNKEVSEESTNYADYIWSLIKGEDGTDGINGIDGVDGKTYYTWVKYADDSAGSGITDDPTGKEYIGLAYNKDTPTESADPSDYTWSLFKGKDGVDGKDGVNGVNSYFHVMYSQEADGHNMSATPDENTQYMGVQSSASPIPSDDPLDYTWTQCRGQDGKDGVDGTPGQAGEDGKTQYLHIKYSDDGKTFTGNILAGLTASSFENGGFEEDSGAPTDDNYRIRLKDPIDVDMETSYVFDTHNSKTHFELFFYDTGDSENPFIIGSLTNGQIRSLDFYTKRCASVYLLIVSSDTISNDDSVYAGYEADGLCPEVRPVNETGETLGGYIGTLVDFNEKDSTTFSDYTWKKFTDDVDDELADLNDRLDHNVDIINGNISNITDELKEQIKLESGSIRDEFNEKFDDIDNIVSEKVDVSTSYIDAKYNTLIENINDELEAHKADVGQYMTFNDDGLTLGATSSEFKTVIDNQGMYFKQGDTVVSYVNNNQLHIPNAVIESTLILGNFFFCPREDGGVSLTWQE